MHPTDNLVEAFGKLSDKFMHRKVLVQEKNVPYYITLNPVMNPINPNSQLD